jgi:hypothetical protein
MCDTGGVAQRVRSNHIMLHARLELLSEALVFYVRILSTDSHRADVKSGRDMAMAEVYATV